MTTIVTRSGKGSSLSWTEADANFTNLNNDKLETSTVGVTVQPHSNNLDSFATVAPTTAGLALLDDVDVIAQRTTLGLGNVDNTSDATKNAATVTLTNKTLTTPVINTNINFSGITGAIQVNGVDKVIIPATGAVKTPGNVVAFSARPSTTATISTATWTFLIFNSEEFDTTNSFDVVTGKFQPTVAGYYQFNVAVQGTGATNITTVGAGFYKNKTTGQADYYSLWEAPAGAPDPAASCSALIYLNGSTDYVLPTTYMTGTGTLTWLNNNASFFQGHLLGAT